MAAAFLLLFSGGICGIIHLNLFNSYKFDALNSIWSSYSAYSRKLMLLKLLWLYWRNRKGHTTLTSWFLQLRACTGSK